MKKKAILLITICTIFCSSVIAFAYVTRAPRDEDLLNTDNNVLDEGLPMTNAPFVSKQEGVINVNFKGEYLFFVNPPILKENALYVPLRTIAPKYDFNIEKNDKGYTLTKNNFKVSVLEDNIINVNDKEFKGENKSFIKNNVFYVPLKDFVLSLGGSYSFSNNEAVIR